MSPEHVDDPKPGTPPAADREVRYEHTRNVAPLLSRLQASLLVSTYQAGKLVVVGARKETLSLAFPYAAPSTSATSITLPVSQAWLMARVTARVLIASE